MASIGGIGSGVKNSTAEINAMWDALLTSHNTASTFGNFVQAITSGSAKQTQLAEDSARFTITSSGSLDIQPGSGEFDTFNIQTETDEDQNVQLTNGTNDTKAYATYGSLRTMAQRGVMTNIIYTYINNLFAGTVTIQRAIITMSEEA